MITTQTEEPRYEEPRYISLPSEKIIIIFTEEDKKFLKSIRIKYDD